MKRYRIKITGIVQGVGFRPFIYNLAVRLGLKGWVGNADSDVIIEIESVQEQLQEFIDKVSRTAPALSKIESIQYDELPITGFREFSIKHSHNNSRGPVFISPDVCTCIDCLNELNDPGDRRYNYPFINCTNCGPRFTIINDIPYDRDKTTMACFEMCETCHMEYTEPSDRRYHAQPVSCHDCGPSLRLLNEDGGDISESFQGSSQIIQFIGDSISNGKIAAIKGIGGYHLACSGLNMEAVERLRRRKHRDDKPFAVMIKNVETIREYCVLSEKEQKLLESPASPIVLLAKKADAELPDAIAGINKNLGVMLPYTPVHHLLFQQPGFPEVVVMTSGNLSSEPIFYKDAEAIEGLSGIADVYLSNNREIHIRTDDSVTRVFGGREYMLRRSRGYVPKPLKVDVCKLLNLPEGKEVPSVLACGGELKNVFCMNRGNLFYLSHHIGDLENESTNLAFRSGIEHFKKLFDIKPVHIAYDLHPNYYSTQYALEQEFNNKTGVQHHKAHIASCMADNGLGGEVIGVSFDGTGYGEDGHIWGGEFFKGGYYGFERRGHLEYVMMPGSGSAVKHPWKMAVSNLYSAGLLDLLDEGKILNDINRNDIYFTLKMLDRKLNCPETSSMGRLFDAVSALLGIKTDISYEGQAAIELEYYAVEDAPAYDVVIEKSSCGFVVKTSTIIRQLMNDLLNGKSREYISSRFHFSVAELVLQGCRAIREESGMDRVILSGGVFQNITLLKLSVNILKDNGFDVYIHSEVPSNDGGIALGQAMMALAQVMREPQ